MSCGQKEKIQRGMAVLSVTMIVLAIVTIITFFSARIIVTDNKIYQNQQNAAYAFNAAQSGIDYALGYLNAASSNQTAIIVTGLSSCASASSTRCLASGTLQACGVSPDLDPTNTLSANNATYTMRYSCTAVGNTTTLGISSRGVSPDGRSNKTLSINVYKYSGGVSPIVVYGSGAGSVVLNKSCTLSNTVAGSTQTVLGYSTTNGFMTLSGSGPASTSTATGTPYACTGAQSIPPYPGGGSCLDITTTDAGIKTIQAASNPAQTFETTYLGKIITSFSSSANYVVTCTATATFTAATTLTGGGSCTCTPMPACATQTLNGLNGSTVYFNMNTGTARALTLNGVSAGSSGSLTYVVVGNASALNFQNANNIVGGVYTNSPISMTSGATHKGALFSSSSVTLNKNNVITGAVYGQTLSLSSSSSIVYNGTDGVLGGNSGVSQFGAISGSWRDF